MQPQPKERTMISTPQDLRARISEFTTGVWTIGAIAALFESGLAAQLREPRSAEELAAHCPGLARGQIERCLAVAASAGVLIAEGARYRLVEGALPFTMVEPMRASLQGEMRSSLMQALALLDASKAAAPMLGWNHTDRAMLQSQGDASAGLPPMWKMNVFPQLGDLAARLEQPGARFLDVGVGVGALAIAACRTWPELHVVGLDASEAPLAIARENVARAGLQARIELRHGLVEQMADEAVFDLAWLPSFFIPAQALTAAAQRVRASLRPGGFVLFPVLGNAGTSPQHKATMALMNELWGGPSLGTLEAENLLQQAGFSGVRTLPAPNGAPGLVVGTR
jgi:SAM-dependent methyltransferase